MISFILIGFLLNIDTLDNVGLKLCSGLAGDMIAIGSQNGSVYLFRVSRDGSSYKKCNKIRGGPPLTQLDWSSDGNYLQTTTADYDLIFCK